MANYYPVYIDLNHKPVLVVGGGTVACRKVETLLRYGAMVRIISPEIIPALQPLIDGVHCIWINKTYEREDIQNAVLVFSCTEKEEVNARVAQDAKARNILINVVDDPEKCSFFVPSVLKRGDLSIAVSTGGSSPLVARQIREELENFYGNEMAEYLELLRTWRLEAKNKLPGIKRQKLWAQVTDGRVLQLIKKGQLDQAKEVIENCFQSLLD
ncbi:MAG: bifunctional precorrin-2 dehydrogenase/sirohydrochlorin ferrochelatase [Peptococcaceae bacterium]|nr:bifunctional precorrin-2 dehydrogenase/sirohydrochlorin ferrochelatase [Peptococcaceae bacterium]